MADHHMYDQRKLIEQMREALEGGVCGYMCPMTKEECKQSPCCVKQALEAASMKKAPVAEG